MQLTQAGHQIYVQKGAGLGSAISDEEYEKQGAKLVDTADEVWDNEMVMKVKEPLPEEYDRIKDQLLFTYFHLAADQNLTETL